MVHPLDTSYIVSHLPRPLAPCISFASIHKLELRVIPVDRWFLWFPYRGFLPGLSSEVTQLCPRQGHVHHLHLKA